MVSISYLTELKDLLQNLPLNKIYLTLPYLTPEPSLAGCQQNSMEPIPLPGIIRMHKTSDQIRTVEKVNHWTLCFVIIC